MDPLEYKDIEGAFAAAGMPTYAELLESINDIIRAPGNATKDEHQARVLGAVVVATERLKRALIKHKLGEINSAILDIRKRNGGLG